MMRTKRDMEQEEGVAEMKRADRRWETEMERLEVVLRRFGDGLDGVARRPTCGRDLSDAKEEI